MKVTISTDNKNSREFNLKQNRVILGRGKECHICIPSDFISRKHLEIFVENECIFIKDLTLSNWVSYNDEKLIKGHETQYFDFAPLVLPGNLSIKIQDSDVDTPVESKTRGTYKYKVANLEASETGETKSSILESEKIDIYNTPIALNHDMDFEEDSEEKVRKGPNKEFFVMVLAFTIICTYFVYNSYLDEGANSENVQTQNNRVKTPVRINKKLRNKNKPNQTKKTTVSKISANSKFKLLLKSTGKCSSELTKNLCISILNNRSIREGIGRDGTTLIVFKNLGNRLSVIFAKNKSLLQNAYHKPDIERVVAGDKILLPKNLSDIEKSGIKKIKIYVFFVESGSVSLKSSYTLDPSYYRRFSLSDYERSYNQITNSLDLSNFNRKFVKILPMDPK